MRGRRGNHQIINHQIHHQTRQMKSEITDVNQTRRDLTIEVPTEVVNEAIGNATAKLGRSARIPGFRPGKVPATVIRQRFKPQIMQDVAEHLISKAVGDALVEKGVEPIGTPDIKDLVLEEGKPLTFKATFDIVPSFDPGDLSSIEATEPAATVTDDAVTQSLEQLRERNARYEAVESGVVEAGHTVVVSLERRGTDKEGKKGDVDKHDTVNIELGAPSNPPGFDAHVTGMTPGATKSFTITYPDDYAVPELAGGTVDYTVTLKEIKKRVVPALDDEFAKDLGEFDSLDALRQHVRHDLEHEAKHASERQLRQELMKQLSSRVPFEVPASLVEREIDRRHEDFARRLMEQRIDPRQANIDWNAFRDGQRAPAAESVASAIVLDEIARRDAIDVTEEDIDTELQGYAERAGHSVASIKARLQKDGELGRLAAGLRREKAVKHVIAQAKIKKG
jgi:trigger factor